MKLVYFPNPILLKKAVPITVFDDALRARVAEMEPLLELEKGIGLAAPQVGWGVRLLLARPDGDPSKSVALVNPEIVRKKGSEWGEEGCLSFPGIWGNVLRSTWIKVKAQDTFGQPLEFEAEDLFARVLQHEIDHLDGVIYVTKMTPADQAVNRRKLEDLKAKFAQVQPTSG